MLSALHSAVERHRLARESLLVAVSGGLDSVALLHGLHGLAEGYALKLSIGHVNHGLRGDESEADAAFVAGLARELALPLLQRRVAPGAARAGRSSRDRPTLQEAARALRAAVLRELAPDAGASRILTAHHADDQAETVLLRLLRGSGPDGLGGIPEVSPDGLLLRPLLAVPRSAIERFARDHRLKWREDSSNRSDRYARNRLRQRWLPGLAADFNPQLVRALGQLAEAQRRDAEWIARWVRKECEARFEERGGVLWIGTKDWTALAPALSRRIVRSALERTGRGRLASRRHLERAVAFLGGARVGTTLELPGDLRLECRREGFRLCGPPGDPRDAC